jgi:hypothetical protein
MKRCVQHVRTTMQAKLLVSSRPLATCSSSRTASRLLRPRFSTQQGAEESSQLLQYRGYRWWWWCGGTAARCSSPGGSDGTTKRWHGGGPTSGTVVSVTFLQPDGVTRTTVPAYEGETLLQVAHRHEIDLEGACEGGKSCDP